jgi:hypothetical protein
MKNQGHFYFFFFLFRKKNLYLINSRIEYDAYRYDYERVLARNHTGGVTLSNSEEHIERQYHHFKERYEKLKSDVTVKLRLLDDNRVCFFFYLKLFFVLIIKYF